MNIARENGRRVFAIGVFIRAATMGSVVADMQANVQKKTRAAARGYSISCGEFENQERAMARLSVIVRSRSSSFPAAVRRLQVVPQFAAHHPQHPVLGDRPASSRSGSPASISRSRRRSASSPLFARPC